MSNNNHLTSVPRTAGAVGSPRTDRTPAAATNATDHSQSYAQDHWIRYNHLKDVEDAKNALIEDILSRYDAVVHQCNSLVKEQNGGVSPGDENYQQQQADFILYLQGLMDGNPFITVLIDGNSLLFDDAFVRDGVEGGRRAAVVFRDELTDWVPNNVKHPPTDFKVVVKVYADFKGLAGTFMRGGVIDSPSTFGEFARGFNSLFDFVDVGSGDVNGKMDDNLKLLLHDYHCHQVIFGGTSQMLETSLVDDKLRKRVALLQAVSAHTPYDFKTCSFPGVFRSGKFPAMGIANITPRTGTPLSVSSVTNGQFPVLPFRTRTNSFASSVTSADVTLSGPKTWAKLAQDVAPLPQTSAVQRPAEQPSRRHNKKGQRIDPPFDHDLEALQRVKKIKMCNMHYLHPDGCKWPASKCNHRHDYKPTPVELKLLKSVSRETPCYHGVGCDETVCVYGHRCPYPAATEGSMRGFNCMLGENCRFPREMHGIRDTAPARGNNTRLG